MSVIGVVFGSAIAYVSYEICVGIQICRNYYRDYQADKFLGEWYPTGSSVLNIPNVPQEEYPEYFKMHTIPPTIVFGYARDEYLDWKEWKGDLFSKDRELRLRKIKERQLKLYGEWKEDRK